MEMFELPSVFPEDFPMEERLNILREAGKNAQEMFDEKYFSIQKWFDEYDQLYLLSYCSFYFLSSPSGVDPEATGHLDFYHHYLEILQAFALMKKRTISVTPLLGKSTTLKSEMQEIGEAMHARAFAIPENIKTGTDLEKYNLLWDMRHQTIAVRNWAFESQIKRVTCDLARLVSKTFQGVYGLDPEKLTLTFYGMADRATEKLNEHLEKLRVFSTKKHHKEMADAYHDAFPETKKMSDEAIDKLWDIAGKNVKNMRGMLWSHADLRLSDIFTFDLSEIVEIYGDDKKKNELAQMFDALSYAFGDLKDHNKEHIILTNPVHEKPFIKLDDGRYYSSILGIVPHLSVGLLEDLISVDEDWMAEYSQSIKSQYLEDEVERIFSAHFPDADIFRGSEWVDPDSGTQYENDLLVIIDTFAIVAESKSGQVTEPAKRGAPDRLAETLQALIEEPGEQANRFIEFLQDNKQVHKFSTKSGKVNTFDSSTINYYVPLGVTFEQLGFIGSNQRKIIKAGITAKQMSELAPSINFNDLESIFELLTLEAEKVHYLTRRREFESHMSYEADELDLLAFYLDQGFNIGGVEYKGDINFLLPLKSKELDPYFVGKDKGVDVARPELSMTPYWRALLERIAERRPTNWIETSFILLNSTKEDQEKFESMFKKLMLRVRKGQTKQKYEWVNFLSGPKERRYRIAGFPYLALEKEEAEDVIAGILQQDATEDIRGTVCIGVDILSNHYPYSVLAGKLDTKLFVDLDAYPPKH